MEPTLPFVLIITIYAGIAFGATIDSDVGTSSSTIGTKKSYIDRGLIGTTLNGSVDQGHFGTTLKGYVDRGHIGTTSKSDVDRELIGTSLKGHVDQGHFGTTLKGHVDRGHIGTTLKGYIDQGHIGTTLKGYVDQGHIGTTVYKDFDQGGIGSITSNGDSRQRNYETDGSLLSKGDKMKDTKTAFIRKIRSIIANRGCPGGYRPVLLDAHTKICVKKNKYRNEMEQTTTTIIGKKNSDFKRTPRACPSGYRIKRFKGTKECAKLTKIRNKDALGHIKILKNPRPRHSGPIFMKHG
ncbi:uncharacterized protein LOC125238949 [Leguminivora glycinivorella]|uniref:uncharacterized protein LOC125238949 n=1 Tax=Leguminivora glycinivorella TaxID=1035111 RepID=UPI00200E62C5|nr:uncharacterized protein LOC125238949 [Leguminivora glycinivorella]